MLNFINFLCCSSDKYDKSNLEERFQTPSARGEKKSTRAGQSRASRDTRGVVETKGTASGDLAKRLCYSFEFNNNNEIRN